MKRAIFAAIASFAAVAATITPAGAATPVQTVYDAAVQPVPGNLASEGAEAYGFKEFGDEVTFGTTARKLNAVAITMSSWACQSGTWSTRDCASAPKATFNVPIRLNIYRASTTWDDGTVRPGSLISTVVNTFAIPYRPSANVQHCNNSNDSVGEWFDRKSNGCFNGKAANVTFNFKSLGLTLPDTVVFGISYDTTHYGYNPIGESATCYSTDAGCAYDSLNIGLGPAVTVGSKPYPDTVFQNAAVGSDYCDASPATDVFNLDSPTNACMGGYVPAIKVTAH